VTLLSLINRLRIAAISSEQEVVAALLQGHPEALASYRKLFLLG